MAKGKQKGIVAVFVCAVGMILFGTGELSERLISQFGLQQASYETVDRSYNPTTWDENESPNYVRLVGKANVDDSLDAGTVIYSPLDSYGRAGAVSTAVTLTMIEEGSARSRTKDMPESTGWPTHNFRANIVMPTGKIYEGYFWNRSHLLAKSLGGHDELDNLITGTRMQNAGADNGQGGMDVVESAVRDWLHDHPNTIAYYKATPVYVGDELIPRSVFVDVKTSDGHIDEQLEVYNTAKEYTINYYTGEAEAL